MAAENFALTAMRRYVLSALVLVAAALAGCDLLGDSAEKVAAVKDAEGRAIGGACRHAGRAIEDCYAMNKKADKAAVFAGWRDMNDYMRENKIDSVPTMSMAAKAEPRAVESRAAEVQAPEPKATEPRIDRADAKVIGGSVAEVAEKRAAKLSAAGKPRDGKTPD